MAGMHDVCCSAVAQEDHSEAVQRELGIEIAKDEEEEEEEHPGEHPASSMSTHWRTSARGSFSVSMMPIALSI